MIVLDTNVISDRMRLQPSLRVRNWLAAMPDRDVYTTAITKAEIMYGLAILPEGRRRRGFEEAAARVFSEDFSGRILSFDDRAASHFAAVSSERRRRGRPIAIFDAMIASIARAHDAIVATRNLKDFEGTGIRIVDPWT
jgi:toxin FitB